MTTASQEWRESEVRGKIERSKEENERGKCKGEEGGMETHKLQLLNQNKMRYLREVTWKTKV